MTLLTCVFAAIICSILWYKHAPDNTMGLIIWLVILLVKDPKGAVKASLLKKK